ncbi:ABC transporter ATP-binding protein [Pseudomonas sp. UL073]|uniref:ABC transporter ATP-binding protein n=1 Tax=Zestomonas insulae TaxID=2809017 RepID=A0ABS2IBS6_9GAMM|nr:ABC transporter ATP-binding protein [Pseudomonas insulae]MBM7060118.1 ABC transporter ATP-binding protein [Pseudomonas insulae]
MSDALDARPSGNIITLYRDLWRYAAGVRKLVAAAFALLLASQIIKLAVPWLTGTAINTLQQQGLNGLGSAGGWLALVFAATLVSWLLHGPGRVLERNVALEVRRRLSAELVDKVFSLPLAWHEQHHSGETAHRLRQCSNALFDFAQSQFIYLQNAVKLIGPVIALWLIAPYVGMAAVLGYCVIALVITRFDRRMIVLAHRENQTERRYSAAQLDALGNIFSVFALRLHKGLAALIEQRLLAIYEPLRASIVLNEWKWCSVDVLSVALSCGLVALYALLALQGVHEIALMSSVTATPTLPLGNLFMVYQYAAEAGGVITAIAAHFQSFARQQADYASGDAIRHAADSHLDDETFAASPAWQTLQLAELRFSHPRDRRAHGAGSLDTPPRPSLSVAALQLERGKRYALIGGSGSGKSTLLRLLSGLYLAEHIELRLDQQAPLASATASSALLRTLATLIPQESELFEGTLEENLLIAERRTGIATPADLQQALAVVRADRLIDHAAGLSTRVAERGANWSGGQRQRLALARGVLAANNCGLLLLDEPTASLDPETEQAVYANLFAAFRGSCVISSVHRLNLLEQFDEVLLMQDGELIARGPVAALHASSAEFRALRAAQHAPQ